MSSGISPSGDAASGFPDKQSGRARQPVVLVADDQVLIRNLVTIVMQREGYIVIAASDGHEGLELSRQYSGKIELVITDMEMPRLDGGELCAHLLEERPGIKVLVMSAANMSEMVAHNIHLPFLPKPFDCETLRAKVRAILASGVASNA